MLRLFKNKRAQNTAEYAIMIVIIIGVFTAMQLYVRRGLQARIKTGVDQIPGMVIGQAGSAGMFVNASLVGNATDQYEPYYYRNGTQALTSSTSDGTERGTATEAGGVRNLTNATSARTGWQTITGPQRDTIP